MITVVTGGEIFSDWRPPSEDRQCQKPMGGFSGFEQAPFWGLVVLTWLIEVSSLGDDACLSFIFYLKRKVTRGVCVVVGSWLQSPSPVLQSSQSIRSHCRANYQDDDYMEEIMINGDSNSD